VTKLNASGNALVYSTFVGGSSNDFSQDLALNSLGYAYITGFTDSTNFPTANTFGQTASGGGTDAFVTILNPEGTYAVMSSYFGGSQSDSGWAIAVDSAGNTVITGATSSTDLPTASPWQPTHSSCGSSSFCSDLLIAKFNVPTIPPDSRTIRYSYDGLLRLIGATETPGTTYNYVYDAAGNRTALWVNGLQMQNLTYGSANQITSPGYVYDQAGNLIAEGTTSYSYDALNRMTGRGGTTYAYNGDGTLTAQTSGGATTRYIQDVAAPLSQVLQSTPPGGTTTTYLYGLTRLAAQNGATKTWYVGDALSSVRRTLSSAGAPGVPISYDLWGSHSMAPR
jgi:YD repeat-containing protein